MGVCFINFDSMSAFRRIICSGVSIKRELKKLNGSSRAVVPVDLKERVEKYLRQHPIKPASQCGLC